jgi:hypothetical protein
MPSIQDVADQINAKLDGINQHTGETVTVAGGIRDDLVQINTKLDTLDADVNAGLASVSSGLFAIWEMQKVTNSILEHQIEQNDTIICLLENANELLCGMTRKVTRQLDISERQLESLTGIEGIAERVHPGAAADFDRNAELEGKILECCPPEAPPLELCPEPCSVPKARHYKPKGQDWKPTSPREPVG